MPEDLGQPEPSIGSTVGAVMEITPAPETKPFINEDGSFREKWVESLDEDLRTEATLPRFKNVKDLARSYVDVRKMVGKDKIAIPTEKSSPAEWDAYYNAGGRPKTVGDYKLDYPKDMPVPENAVMKKTFTEFAYKSGLSQKQMAGLYELYNNFSKQEILQYNQQQELAKQESEEQLKTEWGKAYEQRVHFGNVALEELGKVNPEVKARLVEKFGNDPDFIRFASQLGGMFSEGKSPSQNVPTPSDIQTQITELEHNPLYLSGTQKERMAIADKILKLRDIINSQKR